MSGPGGTVSNVNASPIFGSIRTTPAIANSPAGRNCQQSLRFCFGSSAVVNSKKASAITRHRSLENSRPSERMLNTGLPVGAGQDQRRSTSSATPRSRLNFTIGARSLIRTLRGWKLGTPSGNSSGIWRLAKMRRIASGPFSTVYRLHTGGPSVEKAGDGAFVGDPANRFAQQGRDRQAADLAAGRISLPVPDRVRDHQLAELGLGDAGRGSPGQDAVRAISEHLRRALLFQRGGRVAQCPRRIDDVVDQDAGPALDVADDVHHFGFASFLAALVDDRQR